MLKYEILIGVLAVAGACLGAGRIYLPRAAKNPATPETRRLTD